MFPATSILVIVVVVVAVTTVAVAAVVVVVGRCCSSCRRRRCRGILIAVIAVFVSAVQITFPSEFTFGFHSAEREHWLVDPSDMWLRDESQKVGS